MINCIAILALFFLCVWLARSIGRDEGIYIGVMRVQGYWRGMCQHMKRKAETERLLRESNERRLDILHRRVQRLAKGIKRNHGSKP